MARSRSGALRAAVAALVGVAAAGCASAGAGPAAPAAPGPPTGTAAGAGRTSAPGSTATGEPARSPGSGQRPGSGQPSPGGSAAAPLAGKVVGIDPGHNGLNYTDPAFLNRKIWNGRNWENCNTTGTQTASGYTEARFNFNVAMYLAADLRKEGARVVLTRTSNHGIGPCVDWRSVVLNRAHANVAIDIHADGGPPWGRGFTVLEPVPDGPNNRVIAASLRFGSDVHAALLAHTPLRPSDYYGHDGYIVRDDLAGLNLTTVPKVLIECGNMPNSADAAVLTSPAGQRQIARALEAAITRFLTGR
jgi:N-acetylmuramoyl-L-alanine amidase